MRRRDLLALVLWMAAGASGCGATEADEKARLQSERFYEAAVISWYEQHDNLAAIRNLTRAVESDPENDRAHYLLGTIRLGRGEIAEAEPHLREAVRLRGEDRPSDRAEAQNSLGVLLIHQKKYDEAIEVLSASAGEVLNREPWLAMGNLGWAYIETGQYDKAIEILRRALFDQPKFCVGLFRLGQAFYHKKDYASAESALRKAIAVPEPACGRMQDAHYFLGLTLLRLGKPEEAAGCFATCREISPLTEVGLACDAATKP